MNKQFHMKKYKKFCLYFLFSPTKFEKKFPPVRLFGTKKHKNKNWREISANWNKTFGLFTTHSVHHKIEYLQGSFFWWVGAQFAASKIMFRSSSDIWLPEINSLGIIVRRSTIRSSVWCWKEKFDSMF